jgi:hypothetical protein
MPTTQSTRTATATTTSNQPIEELKKRYEALRDQKIRADTQLKTATDQLEQIKAEARAQYGTDSLAELESKLDEMKRENERKRADYQKHLDEVEVKLADVDRQFQQVR